MGNINQYILQKALEAGICEPGALEIAQAGTVEDLLAFYRRGIDFCLLHNFPSNDDLVKLGGDLLSTYGIYVDGRPVVRDHEFIVLLGECSASLAVSGFTASQVFVKHQSIANLTASDNVFAVIDCFDNAAVNVIASGNSKSTG